MGDLVPTDVFTSIGQQRDAVLEWFGSQECQSWCVVCARRAGLASDMAGEVRSESWVRVSQSLSRRVDAFPEMLDSTSAHRYAARACERTAIDMARSVRRRGIVVSVDEGPFEPEALDTVNMVFTSILIDQWRRTLVSVARSSHSCSGCSEGTVLAAALRILNSFALGDRGSMRDLLYEALVEVDDRMGGERDAATRQRKSRCGRCVVSLLRATAEQMGFRV